MTEQLYHIILSAEGVWGDPVLIYEKITETDGSLTGYIPIRSINMEMDNNDNPHLLWTTSGFGGCESHNNQEVYHMYYNGSAWTSPQNISNNNTISWAPDFNTDSNGNMYAVWLDGKTSDEQCNYSGNETIYYRKKPVGVNWSTMEQLQSDSYPTEPRVAVTDNGIVHVVYADKGNREMRHMYKNASWSTSVDFLTTNEYFIDYTDLVADANNTLHYVYNESFDSSDEIVSMYSYYNGTLWSTPEIISTEIGSWSGYEMEASLDSEGNLHVVYEHENDLEDNLNLLWTMKSGGAWQPTQKVNRATQDVENLTSAFATGPEGKMSVVWQGWYSYKHNLFFNEAVVNSNQNIAPTISITEPDGVNDTADTEFTITWTDEDPDDDALIYLYYDTDNSGEDGLPLNLQPISEDDETDSYVWDTSVIAEDDYYIYAAIDDEEAEQVVAYSAGPVTVHHPESNITINPTNINFGQVELNDSAEETITVANDGDANLDIYIIALAGTNSDQYEILNDNCSGHTLLPTNDCTFKAKFAPTEVGTLNAEIQIPSNDPTRPTAIVQLTGEGVSTQYTNYNLEFDGTDDRVVTDLVLDQSAGSTGYTMEAWVYPTDPSIARKHVISTDNGGFDWSITTRNGTWQVFTGNGGYNTGFTVDLDEWQHIAAVFDPSAGEIRFYKNGTEKVVPKLYYDTSTNNLVFGKNASDSFGAYFGGKIDEVRAWDTQRTQVELVTNMAVLLNGNETNLIGYWQLNEGQGQLSEDLAGTNDAILGNSDAVETKDPDWIQETFPY